MKLFGSIIFLVVFSQSCIDNEWDSIQQYSNNQPTFKLVVPNHFPSLKIPEDNPLTQAKIELGEKLFFDPILSKDQTISCSSCHLPEFAFSDTSQFSFGISNRTGKRNTPSLINTAYENSFFRDGGAPTLEIQVLTPLQDENEMGLNINDAITRLKSDSTYNKLFIDVFGNSPNAFGLTRAISAYERTLINGNSKFDHYIRTNDETIFTQQELEGWKLFSGNRLKCNQCHNGFNLTNGKFENNGLYMKYKDAGRANITLDTNDYGKFKVPSLKNVSITAPYMHDGSIKTLTDVISHYEKGGMDNVQKNNQITGFSITTGEKEAILSFLETLTDSTYTPLNQ